MPTMTARGVGMERAATAATKAPARIWPSTPTFTTPARSESTPPSVAKMRAGAASRVEKRSASRISSTGHLGRGGMGAAPLQEREPHHAARDEEQGQALDELRE